MGKTTTPCFFIGLVSEKLLELIKKVPSIWYFFIVLLLGSLAILKIPKHFPAGSSHDLGSQAIYEYWLVNGFQFGVDIIQNVGPLGFILYPGIYTGFLLYVKIAIVMCLTVAMVFLALERSKNLNSHFLRLVFLVSILFATTENSQDAAYYFLLLLLSYKLFNVSHDNGFRRIPYLLLLVILALSKGTFLVCALLIVLTLSILDLIERKFYRLFSTVLSFTALFLLTWILCGQSIFNIPNFIEATLLFSSGFNDSMAIYERFSWTAGGVITSLILGSYIIYNNLMIDRIESVTRTLSLAIVALFILFIVWKHGYVRADGHIVIFYQFCMLAATVFIFSNNQNSEGILDHIYNKKYISYFFIVTLSTTVICTYYKKNPYQLIKASFINGFDNSSALLDFSNYVNQLQEELGKKKLDLRIFPHIKSIEGKKVGYFGVKPGAMGYSNFKYSSAPSNISFASWNKWIMQKNALFYKQDSTAPEFLVYDLTTIDNRLPAQDDSLAQLQILSRYYPVETGKEGLLLKRRLNQPDISSFKSHESRPFHLNEWVKLPIDNTYPVWVSIEFSNSLLSKLTSVIYKPSGYSIEYTLTDGTNQRRKYIRTMGEIGFLAKPLLESNQDFMSIYNQVELEKYQTGNSLKIRGIGKFRVICKKVKFACSDDLKARIYTIDSLQLGA